MTSGSKLPPMDPKKLLRAFAPIEGKFNSKREGDEPLFGMIMLGKEISHLKLLLRGFRDRAALENKTGTKHLSSLLSDALLFTELDHVESLAPFKKGLLELQGEVSLEYFVEIRKELIQAGFIVGRPFPKKCEHGNTRFNCSECAWERENKKD